MTGTVIKDKILKEDQNLWDGKTNSVTRLDSTGGTISGSPIGYSVDALAVYGGSRNSATLNSAVRAIGANAANIILAPGAWSIDADVTLPTNIGLIVPAGAAVSVDSGKTLTVGGTVNVEGDTVFSGDGSFEFSEGYVHAGWFGVMPSASAAVNASGLQAAVSSLPSTGGKVTLKSGVHEITFGTTITCPSSPYRTIFSGIGYESTTFVPATIPGDSTYMVTFQGSGGAVISPEFHRITITSNPRNTTGQQFNGFDVVKTNHMRVEDCQALWVEGTAFRFERPYNAVIDAKTYASGYYDSGVGASSAVPSLLICGATESPYYANEVMLRGTSEQDLWGWHIENCTNVLAGSSVKWHGGPNSWQVGRIHNTHGTIAIEATLGVNSDDGIVISDNTSQSEYYAVTGFAGYRATRMDIELDVHRNWLPQTSFAGTEQAVVNVDIEDTTSAVAIRCMVTEFNPNETDTCHVIRLSGSGAATVDLTELILEDPPTGGAVIDERTTKNYTTMQRFGPVHLPNTDTGIITGSTPPDGLAVGMTAGGSTSPTRTDLFRKVGSGALDWQLLGLVPFTTHYFDQVTGGSTGDYTYLGCVWPATVLGTAGNNSTKAQIVRLGVCILGVPDDDATDWWGLEIYHEATLIQEIRLQANTTTSVAGDGYPDKIGGVAQPGGTARMLQYSSENDGGGLDDGAHGPIQGIHFRLKQNGDPADGGLGAKTVQGISITAHCAVSIYEET